MRLTTLLCLAITLLPVAVSASTDARNERRGEVQDKTVFQRQNNGYQTYSRNTSAARTGHQLSQDYLLASSGKRWEDLSPGEQERLRRRKEKYESLPPGEKQRIREAKERYEKMPPDSKEKIRKRWDKMSPEEKERYRLEKKLR